MPKASILRQRIQDHFAGFSRGDTMVEVLIAIVIVATVLAGAYTATNRSLTNERDSQEHSEALNLAQTQLEALRIKGSLTSPNTCFDNGNGDELKNAACTVVSNNVTTQCPSPNNTGNFCFTTSIASVGSPQTYTISVYWQSLLNSNTCTPPGTLTGCDKVQLFYRTD